jgi:hypothetical protein
VPLPDSKPPPPPPPQPTLQQLQPALQQALADQQPVGTQEERPLKRLEAAQKKKVLFFLIAALLRPVRLLLPSKEVGASHQSRPKEGL